MKLLFHAGYITSASRHVKAEPEGEPIVRQPHAPLRDPRPRTRWRRSTGAGGGSSPSSGIEFLLPEAVELLRGAGQIVEDENRVRFDPEWILEQVAKAPREFELQARNPANSAHIGGDHMVFAPVYGCPFIREGDVRRDAKMADFENLVKLSQAFPELDSPGGTICEPEDRPLDSRHLDMVYALQTLTRQAVHGLGHERPERRRHDPDGGDPVRRPRGESSARRCRSR